MEWLKEFLIKYWLQTILGAMLAALTTGYARLAKKFKNERRRYQAIESGLTGILRLNIIDTYEKCMSSGGKISITRKDAIGDVYRSYLALRQEEGDDTIRQIYDEIVRMPIL